MKIKNYIFMLSGLLAFNIAAYAQNESGVDSTGLPGDNFSLQGALEMFKKAASPEEFEKLINSENNSVNNLDLNGDGDIDYIRVVDKLNKDAHAFILQVAVSATETQDVAVIELEKTGNASASLQIIGDEDLYGEPVIIEPSASDGTSSLTEDEYNSVARGGPLVSETSYKDNLLVVNIFFWPSVRFIYGPVYRPWASPYRWHYYPAWWRPWRPFSWHVFQPRIYRYHRPYVIVHTNRMVRAHQIYAPIRVSSVTVRTRQSVVINNYRTVHARSSVSRPGSSSSRPTPGETRPDRNSEARPNAGENSRSGNSVARPKPTASRPTNSSVHRSTTTVRKTHVKTRSKTPRSRR